VLPPLVLILFPSSSVVLAQATEKVTAAVTLPRRYTPPRARPSRPGAPHLPQLRLPRRNRPGKAQVRRIDVSSPTPAATAARDSGDLDLLRALRRHSCAPGELMMLARLSNLSLPLSFALSPCASARRRANSPSALLRRPPAPAPPVLGSPRRGASNAPVPVYSRASILRARDRQELIKLVLTSS
jgi:hypothetical protein